MHRVIVVLSLLCLCLVAGAQTAAPVIFTAEPSLPDAQRYPSGTLGYNLTTQVFELVGPTGAAWIKLPPLPAGPVANPQPVIPTPVAPSQPTTTNAVTAVSPPTDIGMVFGGYSPGGAPPVLGGVTYAKLVSASARIYSFNTYETTLVKTKLQTSGTSGFTTDFKDIGPVHLFAYGQIGVANSTTTQAAATTPATGAQVSPPSTMTLALAGGGFAGVYLGKTKWFIAVGYEALKTTTSPQGMFKVGLGRSN